MMRAQQAIAFGGWPVTAAHHYDRIFTAHGVTDLLCGNAAGDGPMNFVVPLRVVRATLLSVPEQFQLLDDHLWCRLIMVSLFIGEFAKPAGWHIRRFLTVFTVRGSGRLLYLALQIAGVGTLLSGEPDCHHRQTRTGHA